MKTSIIVCAYNEQDTIFNVVAACCKHNPEAEIIVVDDGSTDDTEVVLETLSFHYDFAYLKLTENHGKNYAMAYGVEYATNEIILFFDANVTEVRKDHFSAMLTPLVSGKAELVVGSPSGLTVDFSLNPYKTLLGQKALLKKDVLPILKDISEIRYGVDTYILLHYQTLGKRIHFAALHGLQIPTEALETPQLNTSATVHNETFEVAHALLSNIDLMTKRLQNNIQKTQNYTQSTITSVQIELNHRMKILKDRVGSIEMKSLKNAFQEAV
ncbi:glycosyltransferase family 2 protein [uncultured Draconibacterium sp.]|uniref:glycosyltransferase family 2 protein n=1 Tax=uncultured Draconibacterium sp. TaxID=1573823 RepID=UPI00326150D0